MANAEMTMATINAYGKDISVTALRMDTNGYFFFVSRNGQYIARFDFDANYNGINAAIMRNANYGYVNCSRAYALRVIRTRAI